METCWELGHELALVTGVNHSSFGATMGRKTSSMCASVPHMPNADSSIVLSGMDSIVGHTTQSHCMRR